MSPAKEFNHIRSMQAIQPSQDGLLSLDCIVSPAGTAFIADAMLSKLTCQGPNWNLSVRCADSQTHPMLLLDLMEAGEGAALELSLLPLLCLAAAVMKQPLSTRLKMTHISRCHSLVGIAFCR